MGMVQRFNGWGARAPARVLLDALVQQLPLTPGKIGGGADFHMRGAYAPRFPPPFGGWRSQSGQP